MPLTQMIVILHVSKAMLLLWQPLLLATLIGGVIAGVIFVRMHRQWGVALAIGGGIALVMYGPLHKVRVHNIQRQTMMDNPLVDRQTIDV